MNYLDKLIGDIELHSVEGIIDCFNHGISPNDQYRDLPLIYELTSEYTRSAKFSDCVRAFVDFGLVMEDKALLAVLLNDAKMLEAALAGTPALLQKKYTMRCAYTPFYEVSLLHICAEFNHLQAAEILVEQGLSVDTRAGIDATGFGGQTPIFHTVNQNNNRSAEMLHFLLDKKAELLVTVPGFVWGDEYEWETFIPAVNPISYAMMGLLPQMHRNDKTIAAVVSLLVRAAYGIDYIPKNIPNKYLS